MQAVATKKTANLENIRGAIAAKMDAASFTSWIAPLNFEIDDQVLILTAQNRFSADYIAGVHGALLNTVAAEFGLTVKLAVRGVAPIANDNRAATYVPAAAPAPVAASGSAFDAFVASDENAFVLSACKKIAGGAVTFSPLFIYGPAGCGKSLLAGCVRDASAGHVVMMRGAAFVSEFTRSLMDKSIFAFKDFCRKCDTFILDDVQAIAGKRASMDEFLQLVIDLKAAGKNIVITSNAAPNMLAGIDRQLQSLLASGLVADVAAPNTHVKKVLLTRAGLGMDVANAIASRVANDGHMIAGVANKIRAYTELMDAPVDVNVAEKLLADTLAKSKTPMAMVRAMCEKLGVSYDAICSTGRSRGLVLARQTMMAVLKGATNMSLAEIGRLCGDRDHATVLYAIGQIEKQKKADLVLAAQIEQLIAECK